MKFSNCHKQLFENKSQSTNNQSGPEKNCYKLNSVKFLLIELNFNQKSLNNFCFIPLKRSK